MKLVDGSEFDVSKRTVAATKLMEGDLVTSIEVVSTVNTQSVVLQMENGYFLKFMLEEIPEKKKSAVGVRGMKVDDSDNVDEVYIIPEEADVSIQYRDKDRKSNSAYIENAAYNNVKIYKKAETAYIRTVSAFLFHDFFTFYKIRSV